MGIMRTKRLRINDRVLSSFAECISARSAGDGHLLSVGVKKGPLNESGLKGMALVVGWRELSYPLGASTGVVSVSLWRAISML